MATFSIPTLSGGKVFDEEYITAGIQEVIEVPYLKNGLSVQLTPTGGTANVQASNDNVNWEKWGLGDISATAISPAKPVRYLRVQNVTATSSAIAIWGY